MSFEAGGRSTPDIVGLAVTRKSEKTKLCVLRLGRCVEAAQLESRKRRSGGATPQGGARAAGCSDGAGDWGAAYRPARKSNLLGRLPNRERAPCFNGLSPAENDLVNEMRLNPDIARESGRIWPPFRLQRR